MEIIFTEAQIAQHRDRVKNQEADDRRNEGLMRRINFPAYGDEFREVFDEYTAGRMTYREAYEYLEMNGFDGRYWLKRVQGAPAIPDAV